MCSPLSKNTDFYIKLELDLYERDYVTKNDLEYIEYCDKYVNGYIGEFPNLEIYNKDEVVLYIKKLILLFERISGLVTITVDVHFTKKDKIKIYWKIIRDVSKLHEFLEKNNNFFMMFKQKIISFEEELDLRPNIDKLFINSSDIQCIKNKIYISS